MCIINYIHSKNYSWNVVCRVVKFIIWQTEHTALAVVVEHGKSLIIFILNLIVNLMEIIKLYISIKNLLEEGVDDVRVGSKIASD